MELWWCLDCCARVELNRHARCKYCDSEAVDTMERTGMYKTTSAVLAPVAEYAERVTVHLETTMRWESGTKALWLEEPVLSY